MSSAQKSGDKQYSDQKRGSSEEYEVSIPLDHGSISYDAVDEGRQKMLALVGSLGHNDSNNFQSLEVYYNEGATELFLALESTDWRRALHVIQSDPDQARIWVVSSGSAESAGNWSLWRRLPLHEACRRQSPPWLVSALLSVFPDAAGERTQFGQLPLHLAIECGAPPEVINLLIVAFWHGVMVTDQSGRTPLEILQDSEVLTIDDHQVVFESLTRSQQTYQGMLDDHLQEIKEIKVRHAAGLVAIRQQHDEDLLQEQEQQDKLVAEVERLRKLVDEAKIFEKKNMEQIHQLSQVASSQQNNIGLLQTRLTEEAAATAKKAGLVAYKEQQIAAKNEQIAALQAQISELQNDLRNVAKWQQDTLSRQINATEESMQAMVEQFVGLVDVLSAHGQSLTTLMRTRDIPVAASPSKQKPTRATKNPEEKKTENQTLDDDTLNNIAAAASSALQS